MYHRVLADDLAARYPLASLAIGVTAFGEQVRWLASHCQVATVDEALRSQALPATGPRPRPRVCITFDDGYADNHAAAAPILESAGLRASFYVTAGVVGTSDLLWHDRAVLAWQRLGDQAAAEAFRDATHSSPLARPASGAWTLRDFMSAFKTLEPAERRRVLDALAKLGPRGLADADDEARHRLMSWEQVADLRRRGHEIGSHTVSHAMLPQLDDAELARELRASREAISAKIGHAIGGIAYPNGDCDGRVVAAVAAAGYDYGLTTRKGVAPARATLRREPGRFGLPRRDVNPAKVTRDGRHDRHAFAAHLVGLN
ncbi:MAG: polysaccharide deacetylase family protein [Planctomycetota bacterium]|nr:polysaccharide deacetylase family protein [Planctomycetota bacterium]